MQEEVWRRFAIEVGGEFHRHGGSTHKVVGRTGPWMVTLDTVPRYTHGMGASEHTRLRAPYTSMNSFQFTIENENIASLSQRLVGRRDIEIGDEEVDRSFVIKGNDELRVRELLSESSIRELLVRHSKALRPIILCNRRADDKQGPLTAGTPSELYLRIWHVVADVDQLMTLFRLAEHLLNRLQSIGVAVPRT